MSFQCKLENLSGSDYCIIVKDSKGHNIGSMYERQSDIIAHLIEAGKHLYGVISDLKSPGDEDYPWEAVKIDVFMED